MRDQERTQCCQAVYVCGREEREEGEEGREGGGGKREMEGEGEGREKGEGGGMRREMEGGGEGREEGEEEISLKLHECKKETFSNT